jgi:multiple antibiotic resistance protein
MLGPSPPVLRAVVRSAVAAICAGGLALACGSAAGADVLSHAAQNAVVESALTSSVGSSQIFTFLFLTLGPFKVLAPFMKATRGADPGLRRTIAFTAFAVSAVALFAGMFIGENALSKWQVSLPALIITAGALLFAVAFRSLIHLYDPNEAHGPPSDTAPSLRTAVSPLTFPAIATPYGIAILVLLKAALPDETMTIIEMLGVVLVLDLIAMLFAREILRYAGAVLQLVGTILTVLQAALGVQLLVLGIRFVIKGFN